MIDISLKFNNYKCFGEEYQGFDRIFPINVIIGRNNSGKSSLLDLVRYAISPYDLSPLGHKNRDPHVILKGTLSEEIIRDSVPRNVAGGVIPGRHLSYVMERCLDNDITVALARNGSKRFVDLENLLPSGLASYHNEFAARFRNPFVGKVFKHLKAERDIHPEPDNAGSVNEHGQGATNIIQQFVNKANLPSRLVEETLLQELNKIMQPDASFTDIVVQQLENAYWEVYLEEKEKGRIALSESGSGLQTILLVLIFLYLVPTKEKQPLDNYFFAFEELENNVHPALQRSLLLYLKNIASKNNTFFFLTTHSNIAIDLFSNDPDAQLIHITHDGKTATANKIKAYIERQGVLDDLDVRASDLLQSNGVVWVEGPSDRLYFNRWIEIWSDGKLREGAHYQCVFYGGRLLAHLSAELPEEKRNDLIKILLVNRNAIIMIDSDKRYKSQPLSPTKKRIREEFTNIGTMCWITKGREVENYIPPDAIASLYNKSLGKPIEQYQSFNDYLDKFRKGEGKRFLSNKVLFAEKISPFLTKNNLKPVLDLREHLSQICDRIKKWNTLR